MVSTQPVRQRSFCLGAAFLGFKEENGEGTHEGEIAGGNGVTHVAVVLALSVIASVMLLGFNGPIAADQSQEFVGIGLVSPKAGCQESGVIGCFEHATSTKKLGLAINPYELSGSGQAQGRSVDLHDPEETLLDSPMFLIDRLSLRGERRPASTAGPWRARWADCLL